MSSNIVGYEKVNLAAGFNMVGPQFGLVGAANLSRDIAHVATLDSTMVGYDAGYEFATTMLVWDPATKGYMTYGWSGTSGTDVDDDPAYDNQWLDQLTEITTDTIDIGQGVWIKAATAGTMTVSGEVPTNSTVTLDLVSGFNMIANPYPAAVPVAHFGTLDASMAGYDAGYEFATTMLVWDPATKGYTTYGWSGTSGTDVDDDPAYDNQWLDQLTEITTDMLPFGAAVWIKAGSAGTITFNSPVE